jgi:hypothetical protein
VPAKRILLTAARVHLLPKLTPLART